MNRLNRVALLIALAAGLLLASSGSAQAQVVEHGVLSIKNPTPNTLSYQFKWGWENQWVSFSLPANSVRTHGIPLDGNRTAPKPYVRFDNAAGTDLEYWLEFYASFNPHADLGKRYVFRYSSSGQTLNLYGE